MSILETNSFTIQTSFQTGKIKMYRTSHIKKYRQVKQQERERLAKARRRLLGFETKHDEDDAREDKRGQRKGYRTKRDRKYE